MLQLTAQPMATSWTRSRPNLQPTGCSRLDRTTATVNAACPTANGSVPGAYAATAMAIGNAVHRTGVLVPRPAHLTGELHLVVAEERQHLHGELGGGLLNGPLAVRCRWRRQVRAGLVTADDRSQRGLEALLAHD
jgi:hypothetical protein